MNSNNKLNLLEKLPAPPDGKEGWPWTEESSLHALSDINYPKISIVTPSFNQGEFIEETIRSVLLQNYPDFEYIIIDGGSTDASVDIIKKYEPWLTFWISEKDGGQSEAINKGFKNATGDIVGWLNSDDLYVKNGLQIIAKASVEYQDSIAWAGICDFIDRRGKYFDQSVPVINNELPLAFGDWGNTGYIAQPSCLFRNDAFKKVGGVKEFLYFTMDVDLWLQLAKLGKFQAINQSIAIARIYPEAKSCRLDPMEYLEIILINVLERNGDVARKKMVSFVRRYLLHSMTRKEFVLIASTWVYRKLIKHPVMFLYRRFFNH